MYQRISGRTGNVIDLDATFYRNGVPTDPYAIQKVEIYKTQILPHNKVAEILLPGPCETSYPYPVTQLTADVPEGACGTDPVVGALLPGKYRLAWDVPTDAESPNVYFDVWSYFPTDPCLSLELDDSTVCDATVCPDLTDDIFADFVLQSCNRFWIYPDGWMVSDDLQTVRFAFEPCDQKYHRPEVRPLEVGLMPLPLYDYNFNLVAPLIPMLSATIHIETMHKEVLVESAPMSIGIRQGTYRTNPFVMRYMLDTAAFLIGTYTYRITINMPDGTTRTSGSFIFTVA